jgi:hypothetical protein
VQCAGNDTERYKDEEDVDIVAGECRIDQMQDMLGHSLDARFIFVVLGTPDERGVLIVEPAVGGLGHVVLLVAVITLCSTVTVKRLLYVFCQGHRLAICDSWAECAMKVDDGVVLRPRTVGGRWSVWLGKPTTMVLQGRSEYQDCAKRL